MQKLTGRPRKPIEPGKRAALMIMIRPELKQVIAKMADKSGITMGAQAEMLIEQAIASRQILEMMTKLLSPK